MSAYSEFFLGSSRSVVQLELIEIAHPSFEGTYRRVRNSRQDITVTLENGFSATFKYLPMRIRSLGVRDDLDAGISVDIGDVGDIISVQLERVQNDDAFNVKPTVVYRVYRSDDLAVPLAGPFNLEVTKISMNEQGASFQAIAPRLNDAATGELYRLDRFPMLRGML